MRKREQQGAAWARFRTKLMSQERGELRFKVGELVEVVQRQAEGVAALGLLLMQAASERKGNSEGQ